MLIGVGLAAAGLVTLTSAQAHGEFWNPSQWTSNIIANQSPLLGTILLIASIVVFILAADPGSSGAFAAMHSDLRTDRRRTHAPRFGFWITALALAFLAAQAVIAPGESGPSDGFITALWLLALGIVIASVLIDAEWPTSRTASIDALRTWWNAHRREAGAVAVVVLAALLLRTVGLETYPYAFCNDEGEMGVSAQCILDGRCTDLFEVAWAAQPRMAFLPTALSLSIFGNSAAAARLPSAVFGAAAVLFTFLFTREAFDRRTAFLAAILLAALPVHMHFSRMAVDNVVDATYSSAILWLLFRAVKRNSIVAGGAAGFAAAMAMYTYPGSRLSIALGIGMLIWLLLFRPGLLTSRLRPLLAFAVVFAVGAMPIFAYYSVHPEHFYARLSAENIFQNGSFENDSAVYGSAVGALARAALRSLLSYVGTNAVDGFFHAPFAHLPEFGAIALLVAVGLCLRTMRDPRSTTLLMWFFAAILAVSTITAAPPSHERMMNSMPALAILVAVGIGSIADRLARSTSIVRLNAGLIAAALTAVICGQNLHRYFVVYDRQHSFEDRTNELSYESRLHIAAAGPDGRVYIVGDPFAYRMFASFDFFSPGIEKMDFNEIADATIDALPKSSNAVFLAIPERRADLERIMQKLPGGVFEQVQRKRQPDQPMYLVYTLRRNS